MWDMYYRLTRSRNRDLKELYLAMLLMVFSSRVPCARCSMTFLRTGPNSLANSGCFFFEF